MAWERALVPLPPPPPRPPAAEATFHWKVKPSDDFVSGAFYLDGSALDGPSVELMRCGWSFVAVDADGTVLASAYGATPPWVVDIGGAEAWALLQATGTAFPGACTFVSDCKVMVDMLHGGRQKAVAGSSSHARVYALIITATDDTPADCIIWMPAHQHPEAAGNKGKSNNELLTLLDIESNDEADKPAKRGVEDHRVPYMVRQEWKRCYDEAKSRAMWIGRATSLANNLPTFPFSDSSSSRAAAELARKARMQAKHARLYGVTLAKPPVIARSPALGGHNIVQDRCGSKQGWRCTVCRARSAKWNSFAPSLCGGSAAEKWALKAVEAANDGEKAGGGHRRLLSGHVLWCRKCGCYGDSHARGLADVCKGKPIVTTGGGRAGQLKYLMAGRHPRTRKMLPPAIDEDGNFLNLSRDLGRCRPEDSDWQQSAVVSARPYHADGKSSSEKRKERLERIRALERSRKVTLRRLRGKQVPGCEWLQLEVPVRAEMAIQAVPAVPTVTESTMRPAKARCMLLTCFKFGCYGTHDSSNSG